MGLETIEVEPVKEVRRISQTVPPPVSADSPAAAVPAPATAENTDVLLGPLGVKDVEQFLGGFTVTLSDGQRIETLDAAEALDLEKFKGSKHLVRLVCVKADGGALQLKSFGIAD